MNGLGTTQLVLDENESMNHLSILSVVMHVALVHTSDIIAQKAQIFDKKNQITPFCRSA